MGRQRHPKRMSSPERPTMTTLILSSRWIWMDDCSQEERKRIEVPWLRLVVAAAKIRHQLQKCLRRFESCCSACQQHPAMRAKNVICQSVNSTNKRTSVDTGK